MLTTILKTLIVFRSYIVETSAYTIKGLKWHILLDMSVSCVLKMTMFRTLFGKTHILILIKLIMVPSTALKVGTSSLMAITTS